MVQLLRYFIAILISTLTGAMSCWVLGLVFSGPFMSILSAFGIDTSNVSMFQLGAAFGFWGHFINYTNGALKPLGFIPNFSTLIYFICARFMLPLVGAALIIIPGYIAGLFVEDLVFAGLAAFGVDTSALILWQVSVTFSYIAAFMLGVPHSSGIKEEANKYL